MTAICLTAEEFLDAVLDDAEEIVTTGEALDELIEITSPTNPEKSRFLAIRKGEINFYAGARIYYGTEKQIEALRNGATVAELAQEAANGEKE